MFETESEKKTCQLKKSELVYPVNATITGGETQNTNADNLQNQILLILIETQT